LDEARQARYDHYMACAETAQDRADAAVDPQVRQSWQAVAEGWRELAAQLWRASGP
jgi:hypothetical protein